MQAFHAQTWSPPEEQAPHPHPHDERTPLSYDPPHIYFSTPSISHPVSSPEVIGPQFPPTLPPLLAMYTHGKRKRDQKCWHCTNDRRKCKPSSDPSSCQRCKEIGYPCLLDMPGESKRRKLSHWKCQQCRLKKQKCEPDERQWPGERCKLCVMQELPCSEPQLAAGRQKKATMREIPERPQISMHEDLLEPSLGEAALVIRTIISNPSATPPPPAAAFVPPQTTLDMVSQAFQRTERDNSSNCDRGFDHVKAYIEEYKEGDGYPEWVSRVCIKTLNSLKSLKPEDLSCHDLDAIGTIEKIAAILVSREQFAEAEWLYRKIMSMRDLYKSQRFRGKLVIQFATMLTHTGDYKAAIEVCEELVRDWSLEHHTDIDGPVEYLSALYHQFSKKSEQERRILPLHRALELGCPQLLAAVLDNFPEDAAALDAKDAQGQTNLHLIAKSTHEDSIYFAKRLLDLGASIDARDERERTPLFIATFHGMKTMVGFFLERGADIIAEAQIECVFNKHGVWNPSAQMYCGSILLGPWVSTPLHVAIITHLDAIALRMLNGVPNIENVPNAEAALVCASLMGHYKVVELLLDKGLDVNSLSAVKYNHDDYQVTVDCAFMGSLCGGHRHLSRFLLERGANMENTSLKSCEALWFAVEHEWEDLLELLLVKGAGIDDFQYRFGHYRCETALQHACGQGWIRGVRQLIDKGADPNREAYRLQGRTALQAACDRAHEPLVTMLLQLGVDVNARPALDGGMTALQAACNAYEEGSEFIIRTLLRLGANINAPASGHGGMTALQAACSEGHESLVRMLLVNGADVNAPPSSEKGFTAIQVARRFNHSKIIDLLKVVGAVEESILES